MSVSLDGSLCRLELVRTWLQESAGISAHHVEKLQALLVAELEVETIADLRLLASRAGGVFDARLSELSATKIRGAFGLAFDGQPEAEITPPATLVKTAAPRPETRPNAQRSFSLGPSVACMKEAVHGEEPQWLSEAAAALGMEDLGVTGAAAETAAAVVVDHVDRRKLHSLAAFPNNMVPAQTGGGFDAAVTLLQARVRGLLARRVPCMEEVVRALQSSASAALHTEDLGATVGYSAHPPFGVAGGTPTERLKCAEEPIVCGGQNGVTGAAAGTAAAVVADHVDGRKLHSLAAFSINMVPAQTGGGFDDAAVTLLQARVRGLLARRVWRQRREAVAKWRAARLLQALARGKQARCVAARRRAARRKKGRVVRFMRQSERREAAARRVADRWAALVVVLWLARLQDSALQYCANQCEMAEAAEAATAARRSAEAHATAAAVAAGGVQAARKRAAEAEARSAAAGRAGAQGGEEAQRAAQVLSAQASQAEGEVERSVAHAREAEAGRRRAEGLVVVLERRASRGAAAAAAAAARSSAQSAGAGALDQAREAAWRTWLEESFLEPGCERYAELYAFCHGEAVAVEAGLGREAAGDAAVEEYRRGRWALSVLDLAGYWEGMLEDEEQLVIQGLVAEVERRHNVQVEEVAAVGPRQGQLVHVLDPYWARARAGSWVGTEGKRGLGRAGPLEDVEQVLEEERDYTYMQNGFNVFMSNADGEGASMPEADVD